MSNPSKTALKPQLDRELDRVAKERRATARSLTVLALRQASLAAGPDYAGWGDVLDAATDAIAAGPMYRPVHTFRGVSKVVDPRVQRIGEKVYHLVTAGWPADVVVGYLLATVESSALSGVADLAVVDAVRRQCS